MAAAANTGYIEQSCCTSASQRFMCFNPRARILNFSRLCTHRVIKATAGEALLKLLAWLWENCWGMPQETSSSPRKNARGCMLWYLSWCVPRVWAAHACVLRSPHCAQSSPHQFPVWTWHDRIKTWARLPYLWFPGQPSFSPSVFFFLWFYGVPLSVLLLSRAALLQNVSIALPLWSRSDPLSFLVLAPLPCTPPYAALFLKYLWDFGGSL